MTIRISSSDRGVAARLRVVSLAVAVMAVTPAIAGGPPGAEMIADFQSSELGWQTIDDVVMGGASRSRLEIADGVATFSGAVSLENNGGFASVRSIPAEHDLSRFDGVVLKVRGDGHRYGFRLRTTNAFDGVSYQAEIEPPAEEWSEVVIPFEDFEPVFRGRRVASAPALEPANVRTMGLIIAGKQAGPFRLDIQWIAGWVREPRSGHGSDGVGG